MRSLLKKERALEVECSGWECVLQLAEQKGLSRTSEPWLAIENHLRYLAKKRIHLLQKMKTEMT